MNKLILIFLTFIMYTSCGTVNSIEKVEKINTEVEVPIVNSKTHYRDIIQYDSIYIHDSIYVFVKGDTVIKYVEKITTKFIYKSDTIIKIDTVSVPVNVTNTISKVETKNIEVNKLYWWQKSLMYLGILVLTFGIIYLILKFNKST